MGCAPSSNAVSDQNTAAAPADNAAASDKKVKTENGKAGKKAVTQTKESMIVENVVADAKVGEYLKNVPVMADLNDEERKKIGGALVERVFKRGQFVFNKGDAGDGFYIIKEGTVKIVAQTDEGQVVDVIAGLEVGDYFGEGALLSDAARGAGAQAFEGAVVCYFLDKKKFDAFFNSGKVQVAFANRRIAVSAESDENKKEEAFKRPDDAVVTKTKLQQKLVKRSVETSLLFQELDKEQKKRVVGEFYQESCTAGQVVITQGEPGINFYIVESGEFDVFVNDKKSKKAAPKKVATRGPGTNFGALALMYNAPRAASIHCTQDAKLWVLNRYAFRHIINDVGSSKLNDYINFMNQVNLLKPLARYEREKLAETLEEVEFDAGDVIMEQGQAGDAMYIVWSGSVAIYKRNDKGQNEEVMQCSKGDYFGELALINDEPRAATVAASELTACLKLDRNAFNLILGPLEDLLKSRKDVYEGKKDDEEEDDDFIDELDHDIRFEDLKTLGTLGRGSFGHVTLVKHKKTGVAYALKAVSKAQIVETCQQSHIMSEKRVMAHLHHPFFVNLVATFNKQAYLYFLLEPSMGGELFTVLRKRRLFSESVAKFFAAHVVLGFECMHNKNYVYRDLKPENLLLGADGYLKITDFGFAKRLKKGKTWTLCGTPEYLAPEIVGSKGHGKGVDWWTVGILIYEMLASYTPFYHEDHMKMYAKIARGKFKYPTHLSREAKTIIRDLLQPSPNKRLGVIKGGAKSIKKHAWFKSFDWDALLNHKLKAPIKIEVSDPFDMQNFDPVEENEKPRPYKDDGSGWDKDF